MITYPRIAHVFAECLIDGRTNLLQISKCINIHYVSLIINWIKMNFNLANVFSYSLPKADDVLEELKYKKESQEEI